jgi:hypothetical protein
MSDENCCGACGYPIHATKDKACDWCRQTADRIEALNANTQDVIAWEKLPDWVEWVARDGDGRVWCYRLEPEACTGIWSGSIENYRPISDFPGLVQIGTCDWKDSKQRRPK